MNRFKYILYIIGVFLGGLMAFLEFGPIDSLDENFEPVVNLNYDIVAHILFPYAIIYAVIGALCVFFLLLVLQFFIWFVTKIKQDLIK